MKITVIGCGRWGSLITWYLDTLGHSVTLYGRESSANMQEFLSSRSNGLLTLNQSVTLSTDINCVNSAEIVIISVGAQGLSALFDELKPLGIKNKTFVLCMKGIEVSSGRRLSQIAEDNLDNSNKIAVWLGPGHVQEFYSGKPNCMVIDSESEETKQLLVAAFKGPLIRFYYGEDLIGNEVGAAAKNVIGIAAGMLDGFGLSALKGALMARGTHEISRLIEKMGGNPFSAYGLCHLGDYEATVFSPYSHNRMYGECFITKKEFPYLAEGRDTAKALVLLGKRYGVELPICETVYNILFNGANPKESLDALFTRSLKPEFTL